jgi:hypothetical protein
MSDKARFSLTEVQGDPHLDHPVREFPEEHGPEHHEHREERKRERREDEPRRIKVEIDLD